MGTQVQEVEVECSNCTSHQEADNRMSPFMQKGISHQYEKCQQQNYTRGVKSLSCGCTLLTWTVMKCLDMHSYHHPLPARTNMVPCAPLLAARARPVSH